MRKAIYRDMEACVNCKACMIACKVKHMSYHAGPPMPAEAKGRNLVNVYPTGPEIRGGRVYQSFVSIACMHCDPAPCIKACPTSAIYKDLETGITLVDQGKCIGCKACLWVCPYGAPVFDEHGKLTLCDLCIDRLRQGKKTACEATCQAGAIFVGTPEQIGERQARKAVRRIEQSSVI
ncbi:MAG: 4Fe-4S binding protein [Desulfobacterales bacterium]|nr:4Fe-4S binding protein [Desulfobacterales bacterium]